MNQLSSMIMGPELSVNEDTGYEREDRNSIRGSGRNCDLHHAIQIGSQLYLVCLLLSFQILAAGRVEINETTTLYYTSYLVPLVQCLLRETGPYLSFCQTNRQRI